MRWRSGEGATWKKGSEFPPPKDLRRSAEDHTTDTEVPEQQGLILAVTAKVGNHGRVRGGRMNDGAIKERAEILEVTAIAPADRIAEARGHSRTVATGIGDAWSR